MGDESAYMFLYREASIEIPQKLKQNVEVAYIF